MKKIFSFILIFCLSISTFSGIPLSNIKVFAADTEEKVYEELITYDIWKHSNGKWQSTGSPGSKFSFQYTTSVNIDTSKKLLEVKVEYMNLDSDHKWYDMSLKKAAISSISYKNEAVKYTVSGNLTANSAPLDIKQYSWQNANVEGYRYYIPVQVTIVYEKVIEQDSSQDVEAKDEEEPDSGSTGSGDSGGDGTGGDSSGDGSGGSETGGQTGGDTGGDSGDDTGEGDSDDEAKYEADADLIMPDTGYLGHKILVQDASTFSDDEKTYSAYQFYTARLGKNSYRKTAGDGDVKFYYLPSTSSGYYTDRYAVFSEEGDYTIKLTARVNGGNSSVDTESITILPVPDVSAIISGTQKQNRKQVLNVSTALDPENGLKKLWIEISENDGSNKVHLDYVPGSTSNTNDNSDLIKTRAIKVESSSEYFEKVYLEFLTKNDTEKVMKYTVHVEDKAGRSDETSGTFTVYPDESPAAAVETDKYHIRDKGSKTAEIMLKDISVTYGDEVTRQWYVKNGDFWNESFDYEDNSFGSLKNIIHSKEGVGAVEYRLTITDKIPEDQTLSEYISADDLKSDTAYCSTEVVNVAPIVSLEVKNPISAEVLIIAEDKNSALASEKAEQIKLKLEEKGVSGKVSIQLAEGNLAKTTGFDSPTTVQSPFSYQSQWTSYDDSNYISDSRRAYKVHANYGTYGGGAYSDEPMPTEPYKIEAYDLSTGELEWEKSFYNSTFNLGTSFTTSQDDSEDYLYLASDGKTLIIDKQQGNILGTVQGVLKGSNFTQDSYIYSFSENGIVRADKKTGSVKTIDSTPIYGKSTMVHGKVNYAVTKNSVLKRGYFDLENETAEYAELSGTDAEYMGYDVDIYGNIAAYKNSDGKIYDLKIWDDQNTLVKDILRSSASDDDFAVVRDENGRFSYAGFAEQYRVKRSSGSKYYSYVYTVGIWNENSKSTSIYTKSNYKTSGEIVYGYSVGNLVYFITAAEYWYVFESGTTAYTEKTYVTTFDFDNNTASMSSGCGPIFGVTGFTIETGQMSDESVIIQSTEGNPKNDGISGSETRFAKYLKDGDFLLTKYYNKHLGKIDGSYKAVFVIDSGSILECNDGKLEGTDFNTAAAQDKTKVYLNQDSDTLEQNIDKFISYMSEEKQTASERKVFKKGQTIDMKAIYSDYENDPSKSSHYVYYHYPYNDGENSDVNYIIDDSFNVTKTLKSGTLSSPITKFYKDGMYKVEHWQYDNTGNPAYDKKSNVAEMIFYIEGTAAAPYITKITTTPSTPKEGSSLSVKVDYDDEDKETLTLDTKVYKDGKLVKEKKDTGLSPDSSGKYPTITVPVADSATNGKYTIISKISDPSYSSVKEYSFTITSDYKVSAAVNHTSQWETNRKKYNKSLFNTENNVVSDYSAYVLQRKPRKRGTNVFWSEEKFVLTANASGSPTKVICVIDGTQFSATLKDSGKTDASKNKIYTGELWNSSLKGKWGSKKPAKVSFTFTAYYDGGVTKTYKSEVIIDDTDSYWRVHKIY